MKIVMLGAPGAGKGTQAVKISERYHIPHISTGDIFRENIRNGTELGLKAKEYMDRGGLVPDEITIEMLLSRISRPDCTHGFILDGFPRTLDQADALRNALVEQKSKIDYVLNLEASEEVILKRLGGRLSCPQCGAIYHVTGNPPKEEGKCDKCGAALVQRDDDKLETIKKRLEAYKRQTIPVIEFYKEEGTLKSFDSNRDHNAVYNEITEVLG